MRQRVGFKFTSLHFVSNNLRQKAMKSLYSIALNGRNSHESYTGSVTPCIICIIVVIVDHRSPGQSYLGHGRLSFWLSNLKRQYGRRNGFVLQSPIIVLIGYRFILNVGNRLDGYRSGYRGGNVKLKKKKKKNIYQSFPPRLLLRNLLV